jgi:tripartite-type tricarboxylate transporter receptor subunit TctC
MIGCAASLKRALCVLFLAVVSCAAGAQAADDKFFAGKTITIYCGYNPGGSYDLYARMVARHLGKHIPSNPGVTVLNMPGAGSLKAANFLYQAAPRDGTALGLVVETLPLEQAVKNAAVQYDASRFTYIGRLASSNNVFLVWDTSPVQSLEEAKKKEITLAGTGPGSIAEIIPTLTNTLVGTKFRIIGGYPASNEAMIAMERGEVHGSSTSWTAIKVGKKDWLRDKKIKIILQTAPERAHDLQDAPSLSELGNTPEDKQVFALYASGSAIGRSLIGPPGIPADRVRLLRDAFQATMRDPEFLAEAKKLEVDVDPLSGEALTAIVQKTLSLPEAVRARAEAAFGRTQ